MKKKSYLRIAKVSNRLTETDTSILSVGDFANLFSVSKRKASLYLSRNSGKNGFFTRLLRGYYIVNKIPPSSLEIANTVYRPSYISLETALSFYKMIPDVVYSTTSITAKHSKKINVLSQEYVFQKMNKPLYFGYQTIAVGRKKVLLATREKALLDYIYFIGSGQKVLYDRLNLKEINWRKFSSLQKTMMTSIKNKFLKKNMNQLIQQLQKHA